MSTWKRSKVFVGIMAECKRETFYTCDMPTMEKFGVKYLSTIGPFKTVRGARFMAEHGKGNPHCATVDDAERLAKIFQNIVSKFCLK